MSAAYGEVPNALLDVREAANHPWMGLTALLNRQPYLVVGKDGNKFILEGEAGDIQRLLQFEWKDATENSRLVAASRQEGSALTKGSVLGGYTVGGVRYHEGEWYVMEDNGRDVLPFHSILARIESHRNDPLALAWDIKIAAARKQGYGKPGIRCPQCGNNSQSVLPIDDGYECQECGYFGTEDEFADEPPDYDGDDNRLDWYPHWQDREAKTAGDIETVVTSTFENGGGTFDPISLDPFSPSTGFFASKEGFSIEEDKFTPDVLDNALQTMELANGEYLGTWVENGRVYIDPARWFEDSDTAMRFATENGQTAIWDVAEDKAVYVKHVASTRLGARFEMKQPPGSVHMRTSAAIEDAGLTAVVHFPAIPSFPDGLSCPLPSTKRQMEDVMDWCDDIEDAGRRLEDMTLQVDAPDGSEDEVRRIINRLGGAPETM
jgi:hypothetical protein